MPSPLEGSIEETDRKISSIRNRINELRGQITLLESDLIGHKLNKDRMEEELRRKNLNSRTD